MDDMTDQQTLLKDTASAIVRSVAKKTTLVALLAAAASLLFGLVQGPGQRWWFFPAGVLFGAALGLVNFRWLAVSVERFYVRKGASPAAAKVAGAIISFLKLSVIFIVLFIVIKWQVLHILGLVVGLSLCFLVIIWEGLTVMTRGRKEQ